MTTSWTTTRVVSAGLLTLVLAACQQGPQPQALPDPFFHDDDLPRSVQLSAAAQAASGARADATLYAMHFDGNALNTLGREKLTRMLADDDAHRPLVAYVSADHEARRLAVAQFLKDQGLSDEQIQVLPGANPGSYNPTAPSISRYSRTESAPAETDAPAAANTQAAAVD